MTTLEAVMAIETQDDLTEGEYVAAMQVLIDDGIVWKLQGVYGRAARGLIESGECNDDQ